MKPFATKALRVCAWVALFILETAAIPTNGIPTNGIPTNGIPTNGIPTNGIPTNGIPTNGIPTNGIPTNGIPTNGIPTNGIGLELLERSLLFANGLVHETFIHNPFTQATLTKPDSPLFQVWSDPYSTLLLSYLWQDAHRFGDDFVFVAPSGSTFHFYGNLGLCDYVSTGWAVNTEQDDPCAQWVSALIIAQINQGGAHNLLSVRGPSSRAGTSFIGTQLTAMSAAMHSFDYKFGTREPVEALKDVCAPTTTGAENCGWQPGVIGTGTPGALVKVSLQPQDVTLVNVPMVAQINQGIMGRNHPFVTNGFCFGKQQDCIDPDVLGYSVGKVVNPFVQFTVPPSGIFNVQWSTWFRDDLGPRTATGQTADRTKVPKMVAQVVGATGIVHFPANELDIFPAKNREMTTSGNIFGRTNIDDGLWSCEARLPASTPSAAPGGGYTFSLATPFAPISQGTTLAFASRINDVGQIVGTFTEVGISSLGFVRDALGNFTMIEPPAPFNTGEALGINNAGQVAGLFGISGQPGSVGFVRNPDGALTVFDLPADFPTFPPAPNFVTKAINDAGQIVGSFADPLAQTQGFLRNADGTFQHIQFPGARATNPSGINNVGEIVGTIFDPVGAHGFIRAATGSFVSIDVPGAFVGSTIALSNNDAGDVVGTFSISCVNPVTGSTEVCTHAFVRRPDGSFTAFDDPAALPGSTTTPLGINSNGDIVGGIQTSQFPLHTEGFLATLAPSVLCDRANQASCTPCTRTFTPGAVHVIFPHAHMWLSKSWDNAQDYYRNRSCSADFSTCIATFEGFIDAPYLNPATGQTVPACLLQSADADNSQPPLSYPGPARPLNDADSCFAGTTVNTGFSVTTFFPNYRDGGPCGAVPTAKGCTYTPVTRIAFSSARTGNGDIYVMDADGKNPKVVAGDPAIDFSPALSPDGNKVAFVSTRTGNGDIYLADVNNPAAPPLRLAGDTAVDAHPVWSPAGDRIAFVSTRSGNGDIYVVNIDGTGLKNVTNHPAVDSEPVFSPDGSKIVFSSTRTGAGDLYLVNLNDPLLKAVRLTDSPLADFSPVFSPNPQVETVAFVRGSGGGDIYLLDVATKAVTALAPNAAADFSPAFSPDGRQVAFVSTRSGNSDIWLVKVDGTGLRNLTNHPAQDFAPAFSPDGKQIAFVSIRNGNSEILSAIVDTGATTNLTNNAAVDGDPSWR